MTVTVCADIKFFILKISIAIYSNYFTVTSDVTVKHKSVERNMNKCNYSTQINGLLQDILKNLKLNLTRFSKWNTRSFVTSPLSFLNQVGSYEVNYLHRAQQKSLFPQNCAKNSFAFYAPKISLHCSLYPTVFPHPEPNEWRLRSSYYCSLRWRSICPVYIMKTCEGGNTLHHSFLNSALDGDEWSAWSTGCITLGESTIGIHDVRVLNALEKRQTSCPFRESKHDSSVMKLVAQSISPLRTFYSWNLMPSFHFHLIFSSFMFTIHTV